MEFSPYINNVTLWLLICCGICLIFVLLMWLLRIRPMVEYRRKADFERAPKADADFLPATVVIYSQGEAEKLERLLQSVLHQDYPAAFEVIVVNDGESPDVRDTVSMMRASTPNLYLTFTPEGVVNLSRKKLALTLGVKAARYDVVVHTTTAVDIESDQWLRHMMEPFNKDGKTEIALGFAYIDPEEDDCSGRRRRAFDFAAASTRWLSTAIAGHPFRGTEYNIAYTKEAFMRNKGFAKTLNLHSGDDDIFISEITRSGNTAVVLSRQGMVRLRQGNYPRIFIERSLRHIFTEGFIRRRPRFLFALLGWLQIVALGAGIAAAILSWPNLFAATIALVIILAMFLADILMWRSAMKALRSRTLLLTIPYLSITYPLRRISRHLRSRLGKHKRYTWD